MKFNLIYVPFTSIPALFSHNNIVTLLLCYFNCYPCNFIFFLSSVSVYLALHSLIFLITFLNLYFLFINSGKYLNYPHSNIRILALLTFLLSYFFCLSTPTSVCCAFIFALPSIITFNFYHINTIMAFVTCLWLDSTFMNAANIYCGPTMSWPLSLVLGKEK